MTIRFDPAEHYGTIAILGEALARRQLTLLIGAGVSIGAGLLSWDEFGRLMADELGISEERRAADDRLRDPLVIAESYAQRFSKRRLQGKVAEQVRKVDTPSRTYEAIASLFPLRQVFTTNYDRLLERALESPGKQYRVVALDADYGSVAQSADETPVFKLCGDVESPSTIVITASDFVGYPDSHRNLMGGLREAFKTTTVLLLGVSLRDPGVQHTYWDAIRELAERPRQHFVVVDTLDAVVEEYYKSLHLQPVMLGSYEHLPEFLQALRQEADRGRPHVDAALATSALLMQFRGVLGKRLQEAKELYDAGCRSLALSKAEELVAEIGQSLEGDLPQIKAEAHLLAALAAVTARGAPRLDKVEEHLSQARRSGHGETLERIEAVGALAAIDRDGPRAASERLLEIGSNWSRRVAFAVRLANDDLQGCRTMLKLVGGYPAVAERPEWAGLLAGYHALEGDFRSAFPICDQMLERNRSGADLEICGEVYARKARDELVRFCERHDMFPHLTIELDLSGLVDRAALGKAVEFFAEAADFYGGRGDQPAELEDRERLVRLLLDDEKRRSELRTHAARLLRLRPDHILVELVALADANFRPAVSDTVVSRLRRYLASGEDLMLVAAWLHRIVKELSPSESEEVGAVVIQERARFRSADLICAWAMTVTELLHRAGRPRDVGEALDDVVLPARYAYLMALLRAANALASGAAAEAQDHLARLRDSFPGHPVVLAFCARHGGRLLREGAPLLDAEARAAAARQLVTLLRTAQTYEILMQVLCETGQFALAVDAIDEAEAAGLLVGERWPTLYRGRAMLGAERHREAYPYLERARAQGLCEAVDLHSIAALEVLLHRDRDTAIEREREVIVCVLRVSDTNRGVR